MATKKTGVPEVKKPRAPRAAKAPKLGVGEELGTPPASILKVGKDMGTLGARRIPIVSVEKVLIQVTGKVYNKVVTADGCTYHLTDEDYAGQYKPSEK